MLDPGVAECQDGLLARCRVMSEKMYYWGQEKDVDPDQTFIEFSAKQVSPSTPL